MNEKSFQCVFRLEKVCDCAQFMNSMWELHDLQSSSYWSWQKPYTCQDRYFATAVFWFFFFLVISWVIFKLLILRGRIWKSANLFKVKHISISVNHPSNILPAPRLQLSATEKVNEHLQIESRRRASSALQDFTSDTRKGQSLSCDGTRGMSGDRLQGRFCGNYWQRIHRQGAQRSVWQTLLSHIWGKLSTRIWYQIGPAKTTT